MSFKLIINNKKGNVFEKLKHLLEIENSLDILKLKIDA